MKNYTTLLAFGTFGSPNGFTQTAFYGNKNVNLREFDLNTNAIKLFPNTTLTAVRKEMHGLSYAFYSFAREKGSTRGGTFIGSALYYEGLKAKENLSSEYLKVFHQYLIENNIANGEIKVLHSNELKTGQPKDFDKLTNNADDKIPSFPFTKKSIVIFDPNGGAKLNTYLTKAPQLFAKYDVVYFTADEQVAKYVQERGLFFITDSNGFDQEITKVEEERIQKIQKTLSDLQVESQSLENTKTELIQKIEKELETQQKKHDENAKKIEDTKGNITKIHHLYKDYKNGIISLVEELKSTGAIDIISQKKRDLKDMLDNNLRSLKQVSNISTISETRRIEPISYPIHSNSYDEYKDIHSLKQREEKWFKIAFFTGIFAIILFFTMVGLSWWGYSKYNELEKSYNNLSDNDKISYIETVPNISNFLKSEDVEEINKELNLNKDKINEVVNTIFEENESIKKQYEYQAKEYKQMILKENPNAFNIENHDTIIIQNLTHIPQ